MECEVGAGSIYSVESISASFSAPGFELTTLFSDLVRLETELWDRVDRRLRQDHDLPLSWFEPMQLMDRVPGCRVADIAGALSITVGGSSKLVDRIEQAGWCGRTPNPDDARSSHLHLTRSGRRLLEDSAGIVRGRARGVARCRPSARAARIARVDRASCTGTTRRPARERLVTEIPTSMRAVVLDGPGPPEALQLRDVPVPAPEIGQVLIKVEAFGLNRSELHTRLGLADGVVFPRVLGIEATGVVVDCPGGELAPGTQVAAMMGGMGRTFDGGYAEFTCVPVGQVVPFASDLDWVTLGGIPEMLQTSYGSLTVGLDAQPGQSILIRGGTSSVGMATAVLARRLGMTVFSTTRNPDRADVLRDVGVQHPLVDDGDVAAQVRGVVPDGVDTALELVGTPTLPDTLRATRVHGVVCFTGMLSNQWTVRDFYPIEYLPRGVRLTAYGGDASDLPSSVLQGFLDDVSAGQARVPIHRTYRMDEIAAAHADMEAGRATGKLVVLP